MNIPTISSETRLAPILLSVYQKQSPHTFPRSRVIINLSPHISPTTRAQICWKSAHKVPISPHINLGFPPPPPPPPLGEADNNYINPAGKELEVNWLTSLRSVAEPEEIFFMQSHFLKEINGEDILKTWASYVLRLLLLQTVVPCIILVILLTLGFH